MVKPGFLAILKLKNHISIKLNSNNIDNIVIILIEKVKTNNMSIIKCVAEAKKIFDNNIEMYKQMLL